MNFLIRRTAVALLSLAAIALAPLGALAHGDEDHGEKKAPAASASTYISSAGPRFEAHSDLFEVVGTVEHDQLTMTVDRYASNEPVRNAQVEIEVGSAKGIAPPGPDGSYTFKSAALAQAVAQAAARPVSLPVSLTITAGKDADLLAAELILGAVAAGDAPAADGHATERPRWWWPAGAALLLSIMALAVWRLRIRARARARHRAAAV